MNTMTPPRGLTRRRLLASLAGAGALTATGALAGCDTTSDLLATRNDGWRRYAGTTITFGGENTAPTAAIEADLAKFTELTGITVQIATFNITSWAQVGALDAASGAGAYDVIYADPWMSLPVLAPAMVDLRRYLQDPSFPQPEPGLDDFQAMMLEVEGRYGQQEPLYTLPYDSPTLLLHYRRDLFEKYRDRMAEELGFDPMPGPQLTWEQYRRIGAWFNDNVDEVDYGIGLMAKQHDSLSCEFSNILWAYGGDFFEDAERLALIGSDDPGRSTLAQPEAKEAAAMLAALMDVAHPASLSWDWDSTAAAMRSGTIAMCTNWHENAAGNEAALPGKMGYAVLPTGPVRSANMFGGTGIGLNAASPPDNQGAAWLFLVWATSPEVQKMGLFSDVGGGTPTRMSVYDMPEVKAAETRPSDAPNMLAADAALKAWQPKYRGLRPKIPMWQEVLVAYYTGLSKMLVNHTDPGIAMEDIASRIDTITSRGWKA